MSIQCFNIHGIFSNINGFQYSKLESPIFKDIMKECIIFGLVETNHTSEDISKIQISGYKCFQVCRKQNKRGRKLKITPILMMKGIFLFVQNLNSLLNVSKIRCLQR